jgi:glc operon protein GlcG
MHPRSVVTIAVVALSVSAAGLACAQQPAPTFPTQAAPYPLDGVPEKMPFDVPYGPPISLEKAEAAIAAAIAESKKRDWKEIIAVVDSGGNLVALQRMDGGQLAGAPIAEHKARAAVMFRRDTKAFETGIQQGGLIYLLTLDGMTGARAGLPLVEGGKIIGGIGCSGGTGSQDELVCKAGAATVK